MISDIDIKKLVRCEYQEEETMYQSYYGRIAGMPKDTYLGKMESD